MLLFFYPLAPSAFWCASIQVCCNPPPPPSHPTTVADPCLFMKPVGTRTTEKNPGPMYSEQPTCCVVHISRPQYRGFSTRQLNKCICIRNISRSVVVTIMDRPQPALTEFTCTGSFCRKTHMGCFCPVWCHHRAPAMAGGRAYCSFGTASHQNAEATRQKATNSKRDSSGG